jgi:PA14 domain
MRSSGWLKPPTTGRYRFIVIYSDGLRLWMGGKQFINDWHPNSYPRQDEFEADFASLEPMSFRVEHFDEKNSSGVCSVRWIPPGAKLPEIIPIEAWSLTGR